MEKEWVFNNYLKKGDTLVINSIENRFFESTLYKISTQIGLKLCGYNDLNTDILPILVNQGFKVLYLNNSVELSEFMGYNVNLLKYNGDEIEKYKNLFLSISTKESIFECADVFKTTIENINPDIVIFDNINNFAEKEDLKKTMAVINKIAGYQRTKIFTNFFSPVLDFSKYDFLNKQAACSLSIHFSTPRYKYRCLLKSKYQNNELEFILDNQNPEHIFRK